MKKRILSMLMAMVMVMALLPTVSPSAAATQAEEHIHNNLFVDPHYYTAITSGHTSVTQDSFLYLTDDVALESTLTVSSAYLYLCLNGHTLSLKQGVTGSVIKVESGATLSLCNCSRTGGVITGGNAVNGGGICNEGTLRIERNNTGKIVVTNNHASGLGGGIYNGKNMFVASTLEITSNTAGTNGGGLYFHYSTVEGADPECQITGDTRIIENFVNAKPNNACLEPGTSFYCSPINRVTESATARVGITPATAPTAMEPLTAFNDYNGCSGECVWKDTFFADDPTLYSIKVEPNISGSTEGSYRLYLEHTPGDGDVLYPIRFDSNASGIPSPTSAPYLAGSTLPLKDTKIPKPGAIFLGWKCSVDDKVYTGSYTIPAEFNDPNGITFTALWGYGISYHVDSANYAITEKSAYQAGETVVVSPREGYVLNTVYYKNSNEGTFSRTATRQSNGTYTFTMPANDVVIWVSEFGLVPTGTHTHDCNHTYCDGIWENATLLSDSSQLRPSVTSGSTSYFMLRRNFDPGSDPSIFDPTLSSGTATIYLCLNGYKINTVTVPSGVTMYICNCAAANGSVPNLNNNGTVYVGAGTYKTIGPDTGEIHVYDKITLTDYKYTSSRIFRMMSADARIHFSGKPDNVKPIQVYPYAEGVFATGWDDSYGRLNNIVKSGDSQYTVESDGGNLIARKKPTFAVTYADPNGVTANGKYQVDKTEAVSEELVYITITPDIGYEVDSVTVVRTLNGSKVSVFGTGNTRSFYMPFVDATVKVTFKPGPILVTGVSLNKESTTLTVGDTETLTATVTPDNADNKAVTWTSGNTSVATVDSSGKVTAKAAGTATITATAVDGSGVSAACTVTVNAVTYTITKASAENGTVTVNKTTAAVGEEVTITAMPAEGYVVDAITVKDASNNDVTVTDNKFTMPAYPVTVSVTFKAIVPHDHCICGAEHTDIGDHEIVNSTDFTAVTTADELQTAATSGGSVYLADDIELTSTITVASGQALNLCLNGHEIKPANDFTGNAFAVSGNLVLTDCKGSGSITGFETSEQGAGMYINGTFTMYGGAISENISGSYGGGVYNDGTFTLAGGSITGNTAGGVGGGVYSRNDKVKLSGSPAISGNKSNGVDSNIYLDEASLTIDEDFAPTTPAGISVSKYGCFAKAANGAGISDISAYAEYFVSDKNYPIYKEENALYVGYKITKQPNSADYTVGVNSTNGVSYQWLKTNSYNVDAARGDHGYGTYDAETGLWTPVLNEELDYEYCAVSMSPKDVLIVEFEDEVPGKVSLSSEDAGYIMTREGEKYVFQALGNSMQHLVVKLASDTTLPHAKATLLRGETLDGQTSANLKTNRLNTGTYVCKVTWNMGTPDNTFDDYTLTSQPVDYVRPSSRPSANPSYPVVADKSEAVDGTIGLSASNAKKGSTVTVTVTPDKYYGVEKVIVRDESGKEIQVTENADGTYSFKMPSGKVTVEAVYIWENPFVDVKEGTYYIDPVEWALKNDITAGTSKTTFSPNSSCTRAQMVTFLWNSAGRPEPSSDDCAFNDVSKDSYYEKAVRWAYENGITKGTSETTFSPDMECSRAHMATFLCQMADGKAESDTNAFVDVKSNAYYADSVQWAVENGITKGTGNNKYSPDATCTRGQMVTFLYQYYNK